MSKSITALRIAFIAAVVMLVPPLFAQSTSTYTEYAAKFICGTASSGALAVAPGTYHTTINVHNPNLFTSDSPLSFLKKVVLAHAEGATPTAPSAYKQDSLANDYAEEITCTTVRQLLGSAAPPAPAFIDGFVVIVVPPASNPNQLDVVGVYTSSNNPPTAIQIVPIAARILVPPAPDAAVEGR